MFSFLTLASCGARSTLDESEPGQAGCRVSVEVPAGPITDRSCGSTCTLESTDARGRALRLECDSGACRLFVGEAFMCECTDLDYALTCSKGVPTCLARGIFSFDDVTFVPCD